MIHFHNDRNIFTRAVALLHKSVCFVFFHQCFIMGKYIAVMMAQKSLPKGHKAQSLPLGSSWHAWMIDMN